MSNYYDRDGKPMEMMDWAKRASESYRRVGWDVLLTKRIVSTVWLGLDHSFSAGGPPIIFESMVFDCDEAGKIANYGELDCDRYSTEAEALAGHAAMVEKWSHAQPEDADAVDPVSEKVTG